MDRRKGSHYGFYWSPPVDQEEQLIAQIECLVSTGANTVFIPHQRLNQSLIRCLRKQKISILVDVGLFVGEQVRQRFPDSVPIDAAGLPFERDGWYVPACPNHPQVRRHHLYAIGNLLDQYAPEIDGIWLDFIRFPVRWEGQTPELRPLCFCRYCLNLFLQGEREEYSPQETGAHAKIILHERLEEWIGWKCRRIAHFVQEVRALIKARGRTLHLGMFALPWRRTDFDGAMRSVAGQDLAMLADDIDSFSPMVYHKLCAQSPDWIESVVRDHTAWTDKPVLPIVQAVHRPDTMSPAQLSLALAHALDSSRTGAMIFTLDPILASKELAGIVRRHFLGSVT